MPIAVKFTQQGIDELDKRLSGLEKFRAKQTLQGPLLEAAAPWVDRWKQIVPSPTNPGRRAARNRRRPTGKLQQALQAKVKDYKDGYVLTLIVGADYSVAPHEHLVERGHNVVIGRQGLRGRKPSTSLAMRSGGKVRGGWHGRKTGKQTAAAREALLLRRVGEEIDKIAKG